MQRDYLSLDALPAWAALNGVVFGDVHAADIDGRGKGLVASKDISPHQGTTEPPVLLTIPKDLVLSAEGVEEFAKENQAFRQLLDASGHQTLRGDILLYLLVQLVLSSTTTTTTSSTANELQCAKTAWTQYFKMLPESIPLPTTWSEAELFLLRGTSLEESVKAKLSALTKEFDTIKAKVVGIPFWDEIICIDETITVHDWVLLDALYRSRSLELPRSGEAMVPCLDLTNHSSDYTAQFEENSDDQVVLLLRDGAQVSAGNEVTISYGMQKSAAEMLFSYGFVEAGSPARSLVLPLELMEDDPLLRAKLHAFKDAPTLTLRGNDSGFQNWSAPFAYLMCVNEEDGLNFKILQETDGTRHMRMFWQDDDVTDRQTSFREVISSHELAKIFELRVVTIVLELIQGTLHRLEAYNGLESEENQSMLRPEVIHSAVQLRKAERELMTMAMRGLEAQRDAMFEDPIVLAYLEAAVGTQEGEPDTVDDDDFS
ncbi:N-lysine methyltransferase SETD6 [Microdochium nivale]|nr:N-lysine methyltransferase SETD6 [Microdochium nivale]